MASPQESSGHDYSTKSPPCTVHEQAEPGGGGVAGELFTVENVAFTSCDGDSQVENIDKAEDIEQAPGPSGLQAPVIVQQAFCGEDDPPSLCEYERLRERNIREREEAMKEAMDEINEAKQEMKDNAPGVVDKRKALEELGGKNKRRKKEVVQVRRSGRDRKPVTYTVDEDLDGRSRKRTRGVTENNSTVRRRSTNARAQVSSTRTLRPRQPVDYAEIPELEADGFIWCSTCATEEYNGCEKHVTLFGDNKMFKLEIGQSAIKGVNVGQGLFNRGKFIPEGTLFGPYTGNFIPAAEYEEVEKAGMESGNAWEIRDKDNKKTVGFIDPGMKPDPTVHWMSKVNYASMASEQNLVGFQLAGQVYYRAIMGIRVGRELLVFYGETYARGLGIKMEKFEKYLGKEDHTKEAVRCDYCSTTMDREGLDKHLGNKKRGGYRCKARQAAEMVRMADNGERKNVCKECGKGFRKKSELQRHGTVLTKLRPFVCEVAGCMKSYTQVQHLNLHRRSVHEGVIHECPECGERFNVKGNMTKHFKSVHLQEKPYKCDKCGLCFGNSSVLQRHIETVHEKIKAFNCEYCDKNFSQASYRKIHIDAVHSLIRYPCTWWQGCSATLSRKGQVKIHIRQVLTKEWSWECQLCEDQLNIWWGCITPGLMDNHKAKKHPVEWEEEQDAYRKEHPFICKYKKCVNSFATKVEVDRHQKKMH